MTISKEEEFQILCDIGLSLYDTASELGLNEAHCVWAGNYAHKVLKCLGIPHKVVPVGTVVFNQQGWEEAGKTANELSPSAWNGSASRYSADRGGWSGHLVIETPNHFFDPNSGQFVREQHGILFPPFIVIPKTHLLSWNDTPTEPKGLTAPTRLWRESMRKMFDTTRDPKFDADKAFDSWCYFGVEHEDSGTLSVYSFFRDPTNLKYREGRDWHRNWNELGCGEATKRIQERRREANLMKKGLTEVKELRRTKPTVAVVDNVLHPPV